MDAPLKETPLHATHVSLGARMAAFGGFDMPIQYEGILKEHMAARQGAALFDTCHMGEFTLSGPGAIADLEHLVTCAVGSLEYGQCRYGYLCNEDGGVIDDLLVYRLAAANFMLVVNAGTQARDFAWISDHLSSGTRAENISARTAKIDLQGPASPRIITALLDHSVAGMRFYRFAENAFHGERILVSRTGYTGEIGFEVYGTAEQARRFWQDACALGAVPAGLGARDTLRLELGMPLYGHELTETRNAAEAGFTRAIADDKEFIGADALRNTARRTDHLIGIRLQGRRAAREGNVILDENGDPVGVVTSGSFSPSLGVAVALGYVKRARATPDSLVGVSTGRQVLDGVLVGLPFYKEATARKRLADFLDEF